MGFYGSQRLFHGVNMEKGAIKIPLNTKYGMFKGMQGLDMEKGLFLKQKKFFSFCSDVLFTF